MAENKPLLTIVTVSRADLSGLERTLRSIDQQDEKNFENLVILSGYTDAERALIEKSSPAYRKFIFDRDKSLYNAMNIGLTAANGNYVVFLNGGDFFFSSAVSKQISDHLSGHKQMCINYRTIQIYDDLAFIRPSIKNLKQRRVPFGHQGFVCPISETPGERILYDESNYIAADVAWMKAKIDKYGTIVSEEIIAVHELGGLSNFPTTKTIRIRRKSQGFGRAFTETIKLLLLRALGARRYFFVMATLNRYEQTHGDFKNQPHYK